MSEKQTGRIKWFNASKGYGFIQPDDGGKDVFLHISELKKCNVREPVDGEPVHYTPRQGTKGTFASELAYPSTS